MNIDVDAYIKKQKSPQKELCQNLRSIILRTFPDIVEEMRGGVPCYGCSSQRPYGKYYIVSLKDHVNLGFSLKGLTPDQQRLLEGSGKTMKHVKLRTKKDLDEDRIIKLLRMIKDS